MTTEELLTSFHEVISSISLKTVLKCYRFSFQNILYSLEGIQPSNISRMTKKERKKTAELIKIFILVCFSNKIEILNFLNFK